jgi:hypothetical protein
MKAGSPENGSVQPHNLELARFYVALQSYTHTCTHTHTRTHTQACAHIRTHSHTPTHTNAHLHTGGWGRHGPLGPFAPLPWVRGLTQWRRHVLDEQRAAAAVHAAAHPCAGAGVRAHCC